MRQKVRLNNLPKFTYIIRVMSETKTNDLISGLYSRLFTLLGVYKMIIYT